MNTVELPWPPSALRTHAVKNPWPRIRATKAYRRECWAEARKQGVGRIKADRISATVTLSPPHRRGDPHNDEAAFKAGIDGLADAIGVDDRHWDIQWIHTEPIKGGAVRVEIIPACGGGEK